MHLVLLLLLCAEAASMVPPHPRYGEPPSGWQAVKPELIRNPSAQNGVNSAKSLLSPAHRDSIQLPQNVLALMVEFDDVHFKTEPLYPDYLPHDQVFFERWMLHLQDFFADASHNSYKMQYTVFPQVFRLPETMHYYGQDSSQKRDARLPELLPHLMQLSSHLITYSDYDAFIIFHAGAGQETDLEKQRTDSIWSTFLTRRALQAAFDPDNDDYPGFTTPDRAILTNVVIVPEDQYHDYFPGEGEDGAEMYLFSIYGVLAHQFGHVLGLPTLFDNDSSDGKSQGIGHWGLMGTGVWNAGGYVPAQLCAWSRYFLGWEEAVLVFEDGTDFALDHFLNHQNDATRLYKVPISATEYFLLENRQQNPDGSLDPYSNLPSYTFKLLPEGEQDYYDNYPLLPYFNFMKNRYIGSEWDFFLPGYGLSPLTDGSGILIWHIDENVIAEKFCLNFDINRVNSYAYHKGVDLEEADGYQHLDTAVMDEYKYGGPYDSYRAGNNDYFGDEIHEGLMWLPTAESYYGGIPLEIYDISASANQMSFSVKFAWRLDVGYEGESLLPAAAVDFDGDGEDEIFYPMPNGRLSLFDDDSMAANFPQQHQEIPELYTWDGEAFWIPMQTDDFIRLAQVDKNGTRFPFNRPGHRWFSHPVDLGDRLILPLYDEINLVNRIISYDKSSQTEQSDLMRIGGEVTANLSWTGAELFALSKSESSNLYRLLRYDYQDAETTGWGIDLPADSLAFGLYTAQLKDELNVIVQCPSSIYVFEIKPNGVVLKDGFPFVIADSTRAPLTIADWDSNGSLDLIFSTANRVYIIDHSGSDMSSVSLDMGLTDDGVSAGAMALDLDGDSEIELVSALSMNRVAVWENNSRLKSGYPVSFANRGRHLPFVARGADQAWYLWIATDNGNVYRNELPDYNPSTVDEGWLYEYADLSRTAHRKPGTLPNQYDTESVFVKDELYFFPNPLKSIYDGRIRLSVMPSKDAEVKLMIFDVCGKLVYKHSALAYAYLRNLDIFEIPTDTLSSGVYHAIISGGGESHRLRFGIEK